MDKSKYTAQYIMDRLSHSNQGKIDSLQDEIIKLAKRRDELILEQETYLNKEAIKLDKECPNWGVILRKHLQELKTKNENQD